MPLMVCELYLAKNQLSLESFHSISSLKKKGYVLIMWILFPMSRKLDSGIDPTIQVMASIFFSLQPRG